MTFFHTKITECNGPKLLEKVDSRVQEFIFPGATAAKLFFQQFSRNFQKFPGTWKETWKLFKKTWLKVQLTDFSLFFLNIGLNFFHWPNISGFKFTRKMFCWINSFSDPHMDEVVTTTTCTENPWCWIVRCSKLKGSIFFFQVSIYNFLILEINVSEKKWRFLHRSHERRL